MTKNGGSRRSEEHIQISARIPTALANELGRSAEAADRTFSAELRRAIKRYVSIPEPEREAV